MQTSKAERTPLAQLKCDKRKKHNAIVEEVEVEVEVSPINRWTRGSANRRNGGGMCIFTFFAVRFV